MTPAADQPPLFDVVMGDAVRTFHREAPEHARAHRSAMDAARELNATDPLGAIEDSTDQVRQCPRLDPCSSYAHSRSYPCDCAADPRQPQVVNRSQATR